MFSYSFGLPTDPWNQKALNSPLPCSVGVYCTTPQCIGVHPGEEGLKRKYFPGRLIERAGKTITQNPCVRLVGKDKDDVPGYYRRRTQKLSWPDWCKQEGIHLPLMPTPQQIIGSFLPNWSPPSLSSPIFQGGTVEELLQHFSLPITSTAKVSGYLLRCQLMKTRSIVQKQADYMSIISISFRYSPDHPWQPIFMETDQMIGSLLARAHVSESRNIFGDALYAKVCDHLSKSEPLAREKKLWVEGFNAKKATGMIMEFLGNDYVNSTLLQNEVELNEMLSECMVAYAENHGGFPA